MITAKWLSLKGYYIASKLSSVNFYDSYRDSLENQVGGGSLKYLRIIKGPRPLKCLKDNVIIYSQRPQRPIIATVSRIGQIRGKKFKANLARATRILPPVLAFEHVPRAYSRQYWHLIVSGAKCNRQTFYGDNIQDISGQDMNFSIFRGLESGLRVTSLGDKDQ